MNTKEFPCPNASTTAHKVLVSIEEAGNLLSIGRTLAFDLVASGDLEVVHVRSKRLVPVAAIHAFVERLRAGAGTEVAA